MIRHISPPYLKKLIIMLFAAMFLLIGSSNLYSQFKNRIYISSGLSTMEIMGNNLGGKPILERDENKENFGQVGGGFTGPQPGFGVLFTMMLDKEEKFRIPLGFDQFFFQGAQRVPYTREYTLHLKHTLNVTSVSLGFDWAFLELPLAEAKFYTGLSARGTFISGDEYSVLWDHSYIDSLDVFNSSSKENVFRLGGTFKLGINGRIYDQWYLNIIGGWTIINLFGREKKTGEPLERGELFTPKTAGSIEYEESFVQNVNFSFLIQYRL